MMAALTIRKRVAHLATGLAAALSVHCAAGANSTVQTPCTTDDQCQEGYICFPEGCSDPGKNVVVEVIPNARAGFHAQDVVADGGSLPASFSIELRGPTVISGEVQRSSSSIDAELYQDLLSIVAVGESRLIPGALRVYQLNNTQLEKGAYQLPVGDGRYTISAVPADTAIPVSSQAGVEVSGGTGAFVRLDLPAPSSASMLTISGRLIKQRSAGTPPTEIPITQAPMELQAFDALTGAPISQRSAVSSGLASSKGDFVLSIDSRSPSLSSISLVARPRDVTALVPTKTFNLSPPYPTTLTLELGDFGDALPQLAGTIVDKLGEPVAGATVTFEGVVGGGGSFRSTPVVSDESGTYRVDLLASPPIGSYLVTVIPPASSNAGILRTAVRAETAPGEAPKLVPARLECPSKVLVVGSLTTPAGGPAVGAKVKATALSALEGRPIPTEATVTDTDGGGNFALHLDPAFYRIEFAPTGGSPRRSRLALVRQELDTGAGATVKTVDLGSFALSAGRTVSGDITVTNVDQPTPRAAPNATLRFFRVAPVEGKPSALLLGEAVADDVGHYSIVLPSR